MFSVFRKEHFGKSLLPNLGMDHAYSMPPAETKMCVSLNRHNVQCVPSHLVLFEIKDLSEDLSLHRVRRRKTTWPDRGSDRWGGRFSSVISSIPLIFVVPPARIPGFQEQGTANTISLPHGSLSPETAPGVAAESSTP